MKIAVIGAGAVGAALAQGWLRAGHHLTFGVRDTSKPQANETAEKLGIPLKTPVQAASEAEVVCLAVPSDAAVDSFESLGTLSDQVMIDATNPVLFRDGGLHFSQVDGISVTEHLAKISSNARLVKTMNQIGANMMAAEKNTSIKPMMFIAGDDNEANQIAATLVADLGFNPLMAGPLSKATHLEHLAMLWIDQSFHGGLGRDWGFAILPNS